MGAKMTRASTVLIIAATLIFLTALAVGAAGARQGAAPVGQQSIRFEGGSGESPANAVIIRGARDNVVGIQAEFRYLRQHFGQRNLKWRLFKQELLQTGDKTFDVITIELADGVKKVIYFDITEFFGKL
jgi:hypothetical protein